MGNLNGPWLIGWVGDTSGCEEYNVSDLQSKIEIIFQTSQSGTGYTVQKANAADSPFASIRKLQCGSLVVMKLDGETNLNYVVQSKPSDSRVIPNFPLEINVDGLTDGYADGNGEYIITTQFKNDFPTYKNTNGWIIENTNGFWKIIHEIDNLNFLTNDSINPVQSPYKEIDCESNCQTARIKGIEIFDDTVLDDDESEDTNLPIIENLQTTNIDTNSFTITWTPVQNILEYEIEISDTINFTESATYKIHRNKQFYQFTNLTDGFIYFYRIRYKKYQGETDGNFVVRKVTTPISGNRFNLSVNLNTNFYPHLRWEIPSNIQGDYSYIIKRSVDRESWSDIKTFTKSQATTEYIDEEITETSIYYYYMVFYNGLDGTPSQIQSITIDKDKPKKPNVIKPSSPTSIKSFNFKWDKDDKVLNYFYKFNESDWIKLPSSIREINIIGEEGKNVFQIKSVDSFNNESEISVCEVMLDITPPPKPVIRNQDTVSNKKELEFNWENKSHDIKEFQYRFNGSSWIRIDKSLDSVVLKSKQQSNKFEIKALDNVGNESDISEFSIFVDFLPPTAPVLKKIESPTKLKKLFFSWTTNEEVEGFQYRVSTWKSNENKNIGSWNTLASNARSLEIQGLDGYLSFEIKSFDKVGNESDISTQNLLVDYTPPSQPNLDEIDLIHNPSIGKTKVRYQVDIDESAIASRYNLNNTGWEELDKDEDLEVLMNEGLNLLEIYSYDSVGNQSLIRKIEKLIDNLAPSKPVFASPIGGSPKNLIPHLWSLCQQNEMLNDLTSIDISYVIVSENTPVNFEKLENGSRKSSTMTSSLRTNSVSEFEFRTEIESAFRSFKKIIEDLYDKIEINFLDLGEESALVKNIPVGSQFGFSPKVKNDLEIADIRIGMVDWPINLYNQIQNPDTDNFRVSSAILFDKMLNWEVDAKVNSNTYSIQYAMRYYLGRILGLPRNIENDHGTQHKIEKGLSIKNRESSDKNLFSKVYGNDIFNGSQVRVVNNPIIDINWKSESLSLYEFKYAFISEEGRIQSMERWSQLNQSPSKVGRKVVDTSSDQFENSLLRFYVRGFDDSGNTSEESYIDFILPKKDLQTDIEIHSVDQICESNSQYKFNKNCWDKFGLFSAELRVTNIELNNQHLVVEIHEHNKNFARYEKISSLSQSKFRINSLKPDTSYTFRVLVVTNGVELNNSVSSYENVVGIFYGEFSKPVTLKTSKSYMKKPKNPSINQIIHYRITDSVNTKFKYPLGESMALNIWKPTCVIKWNRVNEEFFKNYAVEYYRTSPTRSRTYGKEIVDSSQTEQIIKLDEYDSTYKFRILVNDTLGNTSFSPWHEYKTVPINTPPKLMEEFNVFYAGEIKPIYNERPNSKWTLGIKLPKAYDDQFMKKNIDGSVQHSIPDVEDFVRKDYKLIDWTSSIGHPPMKIEFKTTDYSGEEKVVYWITHSNVYDSEFNKTDIKILNDKELGNFIRITGFEQNIKYDISFSVYDTTGHYVTKTKTVHTKSKESGETEVKIRPTIQVEKYKYVNGLDSKGKSLSNIQWLLDINVNIKSTDSVKQFFIYTKTNKNEIYKTRYEINISDISKDRIWNHAGTTTYTLRISGFQPRTRYFIKVDAVNNFGNLSEPSNEIEYVTPVGDTQIPETPMLGSIRRVNSSSGGQLSFSLKKASEPNIDFVILHHIYENVNDLPQSMWEYKSKNFIAGSRLNLLFSNSNAVNIGIASDISKYHKIVFMWRDSAFNYSVPYTKTFEPKSSSSILELSEDYFADDYEQEENVLVLN